MVHCVVNGHFVVVRVWQVAGLPADSQHVGYTATGCKLRQFLYLLHISFNVRSAVYEYSIKYSNKNLSSKLLNYSTVW